MVPFLGIRLEGNNGMFLAVVLLQQMLYFISGKVRI